MIKIVSSKEEAVQNRIYYDEVRKITENIKESFDLKEENEYHEKFMYRIYVNNPKNLPSFMDPNLFVPPINLRRDQTCHLY